MTGQEWTVHEIAAHRQWAVSSARVWVSQQVSAGRLEATGRTKETGAKIYRREDVLAAIEATAGRGKRTDLRSTNHDQPGDTTNP